MDGASGGKADCWCKIWINILTKNREHLDFSSVELDGSHTPAKNRGDAVGYQAGRPEASQSLFYH